MHRKKNTQELIFKRRLALKDIFDEFDKKQEHPSNQQLLDALEKRKPKYTISLDTLVSDKAEIFKTSKFVENLASKSYSRIVEECFNNINFCIQKARDIYSQKWSQSKEVVEEGFDKDGNEISKTTTTTTEELAQPKLLALKEIRECSMAIIKIISGDSLLVSASMWANHTDKLEQEIVKLQTKNSELEKKHAEKPRTETH